MYKHKKEHYDINLSIYIQNSMITMDVIEETLS